MRSQTNSALKNNTQAYDEDFQQLQKLRSELNDDRALKEIFKLFLHAGQRHIQRISNFMVYADWKAVQDEAHSLKSNSANLHALRISEICLKLEKCTEKNQALILLSDLRENFQEFSEHLNLYRQANNLI